MSRHALEREDVDVFALSVEVGRRVGTPVALNVRLPGQVDDDGVPIPGVLIPLDPVTGEEIDLPGQSVQAAVRAHVRPPSPQEQRAAAIDAAEAKAKRGDTAGALADVIAMLRAAP